MSCPAILLKWHLFFSMSRHTSALGLPFPVRWGRAAVSITLVPLEIEKAKIQQFIIILHIQMAIPWDVSHSQSTNHPFSILALHFLQQAEFSKPWPVMPQRCLIRARHSVYPWPESLSENTDRNTMNPGDETLSKPHVFQQNRSQNTKYCRMSSFTPSF